jgi:hypothetical protein
MRAIWGYDSNNIWIVGPGGMPGETLWHYDGEKWSKSAEDYSSPDCIFGFSPSNIWVGGNDGIIMHYDGISWERQTMYKPVYPNISTVQIWAIWGKLYDQLFSVGVNFYKEIPEQRGFILKFNGKEWKEIYHANFNSQFLNVVEIEGQIVVHGIKQGYGEADTSAFWELKDNKLHEISSSNTEWYSMCNLGEDSYLIIGKKAYSYTNSKLSEAIDLNFENFGYGIFGRSKKDMFLYLYDGLAHYNGSNLEYIYKFDYKFTYLSRDTFITENECFFLITQDSRSLFMIFHGKLK